MTTNDGYVRALRVDASATDAYHRSSESKTEQQKFLEALLLKSGRRFTRVADIACGGGALSYHLRQRYPEAMFTLSDRDDAAMAIAKELNGPVCNYVEDDVHTLAHVPNDAFDLVCCWQTLSWITDPGAAMKQLLRITAPGGLIMASSLFNVDHDVDIHAQVRDRTRASGTQGHAYDYNTFSRSTVDEWLAGSGARSTLHPFQLGIELPKTGRGIGTYTVNTDHGRLQISGGLLMNWAVLEIEK
jgi:trans-aconitate methyltransferase